MLSVEIRKNLKTVKPGADSWPPQGEKAGQVFPSRVFTFFKVRAF